MGYVEHIEQLEDENEELKDQMDSVVDDICHAIEGIGESVSQSKCLNCIDTAKLLFRMLQEYGDDNAQVNAIERFAYLTGISLNE